jgi:crossover junction endodeoxyribonuclease RuvC
LIAGEPPIIRNTPTIVSDGRRRYAVAGMVELLEPWRKSEDCHVALEKVHAFPGDGTVGAFSFGMGFGVWQGILAALGIPYTLVAPQTWKKSMLADMGKDKGASRLRAVQLYPALAEELRPAASHNKAESLLLAVYADRYL